MSSGSHVAGEEYATGIPAEPVHDDYHGEPREVLADLLGMSSEAIRQTERRAVRWLWRQSLRTHPPDASCNCSHCQRRRVVARLRNSQN